jgi:hypothetical protein
MHSVFLGLGGLVLVAVLFGFFRSLWRPPGRGGDGGEGTIAGASPDPGGHDGHGDAH